MNERGSLWTWGDCRSGKLLDHQNKVNSKVPKLQSFELKIDEETGLSFLKKRAKGNDNFRERVDKFLDVSWGEDHVIMLDKKNRVFTTGEVRLGQLGLS